MDTRGAVLLGIADTDEFVDALARAAADLADEEVELPDDLWLGYL